MVNYENFRSAVVGNDREFKIEERLFNSITLISGLANIIGVIGIVQLEMNSLLLAAQLGTGLFFLVCYYFSRFKNYGAHLRWPFIIVVALFVFKTSLLNAGLMGGTHYYIFPAMIIAIVLAKTRRDILLSFALFALLISGMIRIDWYAPHIITPYANPEEQKFDVAGNFIFVSLFLAGIVVILMRNLNSERRMSDRLLQNVLPASIAAELKRFDKVTPREYLATILFTDFVGFTAVAEQLSPQELVNRLDEYFSEFDRICNSNHLEKIKTIGDSYMAVAGVPAPDLFHATNAANAALAMRDFTLQQNEKFKNLNLPAWNIRIGLHSGDLVAGVIGREKFAYDVWGDTVNTASRMESSGLKNEVNVSEETYGLIKDQYECEYRGKIDAKGKGQIAMYLILRKK